MRLYTFDRQLRLCSLDAIGRVEVYLRSQLAHLLARDTGPFGFMDEAGLPRLGTERYQKFMDRCRSAYGQSHEPFAVHFRAAYGDEHELPPY